jgi:hypothetical protein
MAGAPASYYGWDRLDRERRRALLTYRDALDKKDDIRDAVNGRAMPPWKPVPGFGDFLDSRRLPDGELATLVQWIEAGAPEGDRAKLPPPRVLPEGWKLGHPITSSRCRRATRSRPAPATSIDAS